MGHRAAQEGATQLLVPLEAARGQHDALARRDLDRAIGVSTMTPTTAPSSTISSRPGARRPGLDAAVEAGSQQPAGEAWPQPRSLWTATASELLRRRRLGDALAERGLAHRDVRIGEVRRRRHPGRPTRPARRTGRSGTPACGRPRGSRRGTPGGSRASRARRRTAPASWPPAARPSPGPHRRTPRRARRSSMSRRQRHDVRERLVPAVGRPRPHPCAGCSGSTPGRRTRPSCPRPGPPSRTRPPGAALEGGDRGRQACSSCAEHHHVECFHRSRSPLPCRTNDHREPRTTRLPWPHSTRPGAPNRTPLRALT